MLDGVYRYIPHGRMLFALALGWKCTADLGDRASEYMTLMWWCCGACEDHEVPKP